MRKRPRLCQHPATHRLFAASGSLLAAIGSLLALLTGCTVGPDFSPPPEPQTKLYTPDGEIQPPLPGKGAIAQHFALGKKITANWWTLFHSPALNKLLEQAIENNRTLAAAHATLLQARETITQAAGAYYPQVTFNGGVTREKTNLAAQGINNTTPSIFNVYSVGPTASFALDPFGGNRRRVEQQTALAEAQEYQLDAAYLALTGNVVTQVVNIAAARAQIKAVEDIIADDERNLQLVRIETRAGELTRIDVQSAASQLASDRTLLPPLRQQLNMAVDALALLLGKAPGDWKAPHFEFQDLALPQELPLSLPSALVHQRPDVLLSEAQLHVASAAIGVATAQLYPNITLSASIAQEALNPSHLFMPMSNIWSIASNLTAPIFEGGALEAQKRGTEKAFDAALANYEQTVLQSFVQVADVLHALANDAELVGEERHALEAAEASLTLIRTTFSFGNVSLLQVLDAERQYGQARQGLARAEAQRYRDTIQLFVAMGGGWREWREAATSQGSAAAAAILPAKALSP